ncbi:MAG: sialidase family protein [Acidimicrobiales bacterium]|nr:sialidase family protein [Acidimicrobiales bacterium]
MRVAPAEAFHARMAVEGANVWVTWVQVDGAAEKPLGFATTPAPRRLARSTDGGATFAAAVTVSAGRRVVAPSPVVIGGGRMVVGALDLAGDFDDYEARHGGQGGPPSDEGWRVLTWTSADGGATFGPPVTVAEQLVAPARIIVNLAPAPAFSRDPSLDGRVYAAWDAGRGDGRDVFLSRSDDAGTTWSAPVAVAPRPRGQFLPAVGVSPEGRVDVVFYDRADDPEDVRAQVTMASSTDAGRTFHTATVSDAPFDTRIGFGSLQGIPVVGSRLAVHSGTDRALAFWSDTSRGTIDDNVQDLAAVWVEVEEAGRRRPALMLLGALLLGLGGCLVAVVGLRPGHRRPQEA